MFQKKITFSIALVVLLLFLLACRKKKEVNVTWAFLMSDTHLDFTSILASSPNELHIVGGELWHSGYYLYSADGGAHWTMDSITNSRLNSIDLSPSGRLYATGYYGILNGKHLQDSIWDNDRVHQLGYIVFRDASFINDSTGYVVGGVAFGSGQIIKMSTDWAIQQIDTFEQSIRAIHVPSPDTAFAVGYGIFLQTTNGKDWSHLPFQGDLYMDIHFPTPEVGYVVGHSGSIIKTTDGGRSWQGIHEKDTYSDNRSFRAIYFVDNNTGFIVGDFGLLWKTTDGGHSWKIGTGLPEEEFHDVVVVGEDGYIVGKDGVLIRFDAEF